MSACSSLRQAFAVAAFAAAAVPVAGARAEEPEEAAPEEKSAPQKEESAPSAEPEPGEAKESDAATPKDEPAEPAVSAHAEVSANDVAFEAVGASSPGHFRRLWVGVAGSFELVFPGTADDVCKLTPSAMPVGPLGAYCTNPDGSDFPSRATPAQNDSLLPGHAGQLEGGVKFGDVRVVIAADYAATRSILAGVRIGYVLNDYPGYAGVSGRTEFLRHVHLEARGTYLFGSDPLTRVAFAPMVFGGAGFAPTDARSLTQVSFVGIRGRTPKNAWQIGGPGYVVIGGGTRYTFSPRAAFTMAWKASLGFGAGTALVATGPEVGFQYGF
jgi:hypothetical protein